MRAIPITLLALLAACAPGGEEAVNLETNDEAAGPREAQVENRIAAPVPDQRSPEAAAQVLKDYFRLLAEKKFSEAHRLWTTESELSDGAFAGSFETYREYRGTITGPGRMEGAAGSSYIDLPVEVTGRVKSGERFKQTGTFTLRRVNDVPGATPEQLQWRIHKTDLKPRSVAMAFRFVGRWATDVQRCASPWRFTATSLKTPAGSVCSFSKVTEVPGGYDIAASCTAEGPPTDDRLRLRFAESAGALLFESSTIADAGLVRCQ